MASVYSDASWTGTYTYTRVRVDYSGTSATAHLLYTRTNSWSGATGSGNATFSFGGASVGFNQTRYGQMTDSEIASVSFSISMGGGTYSGSSSGGYMGGSWSVNIPAQYTPPTGLKLTSCSAGPDWYDIGVSVSGWGNGGSSSQRYIEAQVWTYNASSLVEPRRYQPSYGTTSATIRVNNSSFGSLSITPNTAYTIGVFATNGAANTGSQRIGDHVTAPPVLSASASNITKNSIDVNWSFGNQGGRHPMIVQYSLDDANWTTMSTQTGSGSRSGVYTITGLTTDTEYTIHTRITRAETGQAYYTTTGETVSATTLPAGIIYGSVSGTTKKAKKLYGSVNGQTKQIKKLYASVNGQTKRVF